MDGAALTSRLARLKPASPPRLGGAMGRSEEEAGRLRAKIVELEAEVARLRAVTAVADRNAPPDMSARYLRLIFESAVEYAIFATDLDGTVVTWNEGAHRILGYEEAEIVGRPIDIIFVPEDRARGIPQAEMKQSRTNGRANDQRWQLRKDGSRFWASGLMMPLQDDGPPVGYLKILRDRTAEREAENMLRASEGRLRMALAAGGLASWELDPVTGTMIADARFKALWGRGPDADFHYADLQASVYAEDRPAHDAKLAGALATGTDFAHEFRVTAPDGSPRWIEIHGYPLPGDGGAERIVGVARDITAQRAVERGLQDTVDRQNVMHREISHRIKNSLQLVANLLQLQAFGSRAAEVRDALNDAVARVMAVAQVHDRLWRQDDARNVDLAPFISDLCTDLQQTLPSCEVRCEVEPAMVPTGVAVSFGLILNELVTNAFSTARATAIPRSWCGSNALPAARSASRSATTAPACPRGSMRMPGRTAWGCG
jgi:PAS domain S-box-containing protein